MKKGIFSSLLCLSMFAQGQVQTPKASPIGKVEQRVGLTDISVSYSRPAVNHRTIFGDLLPYGALWRLGANENTKITNSDMLIIGKDTLDPGTYAMFAKPGKKSWELFFYTESTNWGLPEKWEESKIALRYVAKVENLSSIQENLSISIENLSFNKGTIEIAWEKTKVCIPFSLNTKEKVLASIDKALASSTVSANDYYQAASYYFSEKMELTKALSWSEKAVELKGASAYWMTRLKAQLQAANGDFKGAIETAKISIEAAEKDGDSNYVRMNQASIEEWSKKK